MKLLRGILTTEVVGWAAMLVLAVTMTVSAQAQISVSGPFVDEDTRGDWRGTYGNCFVLIPEPIESMVEEPVGPDYFGPNHLQYRYNNCYEGPWFDNDPDLSEVDWRIFRDGQPPHAFAWHAEDTVDGAAQWNPCRGDFYHATWDNDDFGTDPLTVELNLNVEGDITVAYYFTNSSFACREHDYTLDIDGMAFQGTIGDFSEGKYVYFDISGLETSALGTTISFTVVDTPGEPLCANSPYPGPNSVISGVFVGGDCPPADCPVCGNGIVEDGEECDLGDQNGVPGSGCSHDCLIVLDPECSCADGKPGTLVFQYTGDGCDASNNLQEGRATCDGDPNDASPVYVDVISDGATAMPGMVLLNENVAIVATSGRLKANTTLEISDDDGLLQELNIHTSCSKRLEVGDQFGSLLLVEFIPEGGTGVCGGDDEGDDETHDFDRGLERRSVNESDPGHQPDVQFSAKGF